MIPAQNIIAWSETAPWTEQRQVEQDLIISRALVELFSDPFLAGELRFRGGTALNKLHFPTPLRYSEDIDLVRTTAGPIRPILDRLHDILDPWMGQPRFDQSPVAPKLRYSIEAEDRASTVPIRIKVEINTREREAFDPIELRLFRVANPWFTGEASIPTFSNEELLATKLRALLQRNKGRDLIDLAHSLRTFDGLDAGKIVDLLGRYLAAAQTPVSRAQAEQRMFEKLDSVNFMADVRPLLAADAREAFSDSAAAAAFTDVFDRIIRRMPGAEWARTPGMIERFKLTGL
jgi:predicted nucleotidyltransferase component of viral defense system